MPLNKNTIKVIDFGIAGKFSHKPCDQGRDTPTLRTMAGTAYYVAPEVFTGKYSEKCDVWGAGAILFFLLSGAPPFGGNDDKEIMTAVKKGAISFELVDFLVKDGFRRCILQWCVVDKVLFLFSELWRRAAWSS